LIALSGSTLVQLSASAKTYDVGLRLYKNISNCVPVNNSFASSVFAFERGVGPSGPYLF
jgi:hypothetical protein